MLDGVEFGNEVVALVRGFVDREVAPLKAENAELKERIAALEARPAPEKGEPGDNGISPDLEVILAAASGQLKTMVDDAVAALPPPEPGPQGDKGEHGERGEKGDTGADGSNGRDGAGIIDGFVSRDGHLIATLSDGSTRDFGEIIGKDGRDGEPGKNGRDGFGFDDMDACVLDDDRTIELSFRRGDEEKAFTFKWPTPIDRGVYKAGASYEAGDAVTWGGSLWIAQRATDAKPDTADSGFRLAVKKGRDGKDARVG
jgi:hypothetical protein